MFKILRFPELKKLVGLSRSTVWRLERLQSFPSRIRISRRCIGWKEEDVQKWLDQQQVNGTPQNG